jgi:hypothetical protein
LARCDPGVHVEAASIATPGDEQLGGGRRHAAQPGGARIAASCSSDHSRRVALCGIQRKKAGAVTGTFRTLEAISC